MKLINFFRVLPYVLFCYATLLLTGCDNIQNPFASSSSTNYDYTQSTPKSINQNQNKSKVAVKSDETTYVEPGISTVNHSKSVNSNYKSTEIPHDAPTVPSMEPTIGQ